MKYDTYYALKIIALASMLIDHVALLFVRSDTTMYLVMRGIGRLAFPLFCYLLVKGFEKRSHHKQYLLRLFALAIISEIPYNFMHSGTWRYGRVQNVCFTLLLGYLFLLITKGEAWREWAKQFRLKKRWTQNSLWLCILGAFALTSYVLSVEYGYQGFLLIAFLHLAIKAKKKWLISVVLICFSVYMGNWISLFHVVSLVPILFLKDRSRRVPKGVVLACRYFYPAHLILLSFADWIIR